ncbi:MAG: aminoglycoside phosphotransferase [Chloroflexi bacterium]|nr:aminoglycoside phosphotransferase [Chloroflexota bacterium]
MNEAWRVAELFTLAGRVIDVRAHGEGNINDTYLVTIARKPQPSEKFILQRINTHVFKRPEWIVANMRAITEHVGGKSVHESGASNRRWELPTLRSTQQGEDFFVDSQGAFWRAINFIAGARAFDTVQSQAHAREAGYALGRFQRLLSDLDPGRLHDTLVGFHITPRYLHAYDEAVSRPSRVVESPETRYCHRMIAERRHWASVLEDARDRGRLQVRIMHGDPKIDNIMICEETGQAVSIIDLDTVKPGLIQYDIGDCLRSSCNPLGETTSKLDDVRFETDLAQAILEGYCSVADEFLTENDYAYMYDSIRLLTFELGLRFFTDFLAGDVYYKIKYPEHNLERAMVQFRLTESIEVQEAAIRAIIADLIPFAAAMAAK